MEDKLRTIAASDKSEIERADMLIKEMCKVTNDLLDYRYTVEHYTGNPTSTVLRDRVNAIKNSMTVLISDMEIYAEQMDFREDMERQMEKRINKIADRLSR